MTYTFHFHRNPGYCDINVYQQTSRQNLGLFLLLYNVFLPISNTRKKFGCFFASSTEGHPQGFWSLQISVAHQIRQLEQNNIRQNFKRILSNVRHSAINCIKVNSAETQCKDWSLTELSLLLLGLFLNNVLSKFFTNFLYSIIFLYIIPILRQRSKVKNYLQ